MKTNILYFIVYPSIFTMVFLMTVVGISTFYINSTLVYIIGGVIILLLPSMSSVIKGYKYGIECKYWGVFFFKSKTFPIEDINQVELQYNWLSIYPYSFKLTTKHNVYKYMVKSPEDFITILHYLKMNSVVVHLPENNKTISKLYQQMENESKLEACNSVLKPTHKTGWTIEIWMTIIILFYLSKCGI